MNFRYKLQQMTWGRKTIFFLLIATIVVMLYFTLLLETTHGPLTPNNNRYPASFSFTNINPISFVLFLLVYFLLLFPWFKYCFSEKYYFRGISIFPGTSASSVVFGTILTIWSVFTGGLFSFVYCAFSWIAHVRDIILLDDEYPLVFEAYVVGIMFWGIVDLIYYLTFWRKNKGSQFNPFISSPGEKVDWFTYQNH